MVDMNPIDIHAPSVEEAINKGLLQLGLTRNDVIVEIVDEGSQGILGVGARDAHIRLTPLRMPKPRKQAPPQPPREEEPEEPTPAPQPEEPVSQPEEPAPARQAPPPAPVDADDEELAYAHSVLENIMARMDLEASIHTGKGDGSDAPWILDIRGQDLGGLIGKKGKTLDALQYITRLIVSRELQRRVNLVVDVEGYKERRADSLRKLAERMARQAKNMDRTVTLEPMPPNERRIIHMTLRNNNDVTTESVGHGHRRRVTIVPK